MRLTSPGMVLRASAAGGAATTGAGGAANLDPIVRQPPMQAIAAKSRNNLYMGGHPYCDLVSPRHYTR
jgi:hypothetical protein